MFPLFFAVMFGVLSGGAYDLGSNNLGFAFLASAMLSVVCAMLKYLDGGYEKAR